MHEPVVTFAEAQPARLIENTTEVWFNAPLKQTWDRMWHGMDEWWPHRFKPGISRVTIDLRIGGLWQERFDDEGHGAIYGTVTYVDPYKLVGFVGQWGMFGAAWAGGYYKFTEQDGGTLLKTHGETMGLIPDEVLEGRKSGSKMILEVMKKYIEDGVKYVPPPR